jgi:Flp pilus assembly protein protease CpaA
VAFMLVTSLCGAALGVIMLSPLRRLMPPPSEGALRLTGANRIPMPFGAAIAFGGVFVLTLQLPLPL